MNIIELNKKEIVSIAGGQEAEAVETTKGWDGTIYDWTAGPAVNGFNWLVDVDWKTVGVGSIVLTTVYKLAPYGLQGLAFAGGIAMTGLRLAHTKTKPKNK